MLMSLSGFDSHECSWVARPLAGRLAQPQESVHAARPDKATSHFKGFLSLSPMIPSREACVPTSGWATLCYSLH